MKEEKEEEESDREKERERATEKPKCIVNQRITNTNFLIIFTVLLKFSFQRLFSAFILWCSVLSMYHLTVLATWNAVTPRIHRVQGR